MSGYYYPNPHYAPVDHSDDNERSALAFDTASRWFNDLTKTQLVRFTQRMADIAPYKGAPRWVRERDAAQREWLATTADAKAVSDMVYADVMRDGEVSEATSYAFDHAMMTITMQQAAE